MPGDDCTFNNNISEVLEKLENSKTRCCASGQRAYVRSSFRSRGFRKTRENCENSGKLGSSTRSGHAFCCCVSGHGWLGCHPRGPTRTGEAPADGAAGPEPIAFEERLPCAPQGPPARAGGAGVRTIAPAQAGMTDAFRLITSGRAESRAPAPAKGQRVRGARAPCVLMPQTSRFPPAAIICRAVSNAA